MKCKSCEKEEELEKMFDRFMEDLSDLVENHKKRDMPSQLICSALIGRAKVEACLSMPCYLQMLGYLTSSVNLNLEELWDEFTQDEEK